jgi:hypothetical protein
MSYFLMKRMVFLVTGLSLASSAAMPAQDNPVFEAFVSIRTASLDSYFELSFILRNASGYDFQPPDLRDFVVASGPSRTIRSSIINGKASQEVSFSYSVKPRKTGTFKIGAASIKVDSRILRTNPISLVVVERRETQHPAQSGEDYFIRAEPSVESAYVGQQISLDYKLYTLVDIESYNVLEESDYPGFYAEDLRRFDSHIVREQLNRGAYTTKILKRVALFPQQTGALAIAPLQLQLNLIEEEPSKPGSFFFSRQIKRVLAQTQPVQIEVRPLPPGAPPHFSGAVGRYSAHSNVHRAVISTDDVLAIRLTLNGNGDMKRTQAPPLELPDEFEVYEPRLIEESKYESAGEIISKKVFEYLALPRQVGDYTIAPVFAFFDPDSNAYRMTEEMTHAVTIRPGSRRLAPEPPGEYTGAEVGMDVHEPRYNIQPRRSGSAFFYSPLFWTLGAFPFALFGAAVVLRIVERRDQRIDPLRRKRRQARKEARRRLDEARKLLRAGDARAFYHEISRAILGYIGDKLNIPRSGMSKDNVREKLRSLSLPESLIENCLRLVHTCEVALFAGNAQVADMNEVFQQTEEILAAMESGITDK